MSDRKRYVVVGTGSRARMFIDAVAGSQKDVAELVGFCDTNLGRMQWHNDRLAKEGHAPVPTYADTDFDRMVAERKPDRVIVTTRDCFHDEYIIRAMRLGCDVVTEKPMTTDDAKCRAILETVGKTGRRLVVTFNYRYAPKRSKVKELIAGGVIGDVKSVDFEWLLDTSHGADYFRRWHRQKVNSGGLLVHKATHHFDLVNWWIAASPTRVFANGALSFYGHRTGNGPAHRGQRCRECPATAECKFYMDLAGSEGLKGLYLDTEQYDGYVRDHCVFGDDITIEDNMSVSVRYDSGAVLSYSLNAFMPWEGSRIAFNGTKGRLEFDDVEKTYISGQGGTAEGETLAQGARIEVFPHFAPSYRVRWEEGKGGHGGGDPRLLNDVFRGAGDDPLGRAADHVDGARSILTGIAANRSIATGQPVEIADLVKLPRR
ncbi:MAG: putative oxidoreductase YteT [Phycisphaerae bacterium]|nr:putative oxidoreductase YteT [Phycisphaerae bacterium]